MTNVEQALSVDRNLQVPVTQRMTDVGSRFVPTAQSLPHHLLFEARAGAASTGGDAGFTLIELMVVLLILAILLAIAIPTFLGVTKSANDRASQSNLNTALLNAKARYQTSGQTYGSLATAGSNAAALVPILSSAEGALSFTTTNSTAQSVISVSASTDGSGIVLAAYSKSGNCFYVVDNGQAVSTTNTATTFTPYGTGTATHAASTNAATAGALYLPTAVGMSYAETKGDTTLADCSASAPVMGSATGVTYQVSTSGFPS
jgi:type IV pilus assembly protein PilA